MAPRSPRVLVVEDDEDTRSYLLDLFASDGYEVRGAADACEAYATLVAFDPSLVVVDVMLPGESGFDCYRRIRELKGDVPAIVITERSSDLSKVYAKELGASAFFWKPLESRKLLEKARSAVREAGGPASSPPAERERAA